VLEQVLRFATEVGLPVTLAEVGVPVTCELRRTNSGMAGRWFHHPRLLQKKNRSGWAGR
jgi:hypothetical protein